MDTSHAPPPFSAPTAIPVPDGESSYLTPGHAQGSGRPPQNPSPGTTSSHLPPQYQPLPPQNAYPLAYPLASQQIPVSSRPPPAFPQIVHAHYPFGLPHDTQTALQARVCQSSSLQAEKRQLPTSRCRYHGCHAPVGGDVAVRLGGFCSDAHMSLAIHNGTATQCHRSHCQRVCPVGSEYCSAPCANGQA